MARLRRFLQLSWAEKLLLARAWWLLLAVDLGLRSLSFQRVESFLDRPDRVATENGETQLDAAERVLRVVGMAANHHLYPMRCLVRSLASRRLLQLQGIQARLCIGVRKKEEGLLAHAWLEHRGQALSEPETIESDFALLT